MATGRGSITVLPPSPLDDDEQRPLLDAAHPDHGTIDPRIEGEEEDGDTDVIDEPTSAKVVLIMMCLWVGSFWAAMGAFSSSSRSPNSVTDYASL
jgi:hypothetical protein